MKPVSRIVAGQPAWIVENSSVRAAITEQGAMMAPVEFFSHGHAPIRPYYLSPWQESDEMPANPVHVPLRGEFFCLPFGAATEREGVRYPQHGEPAAQRWTFGSYERSERVTRFSARIGTTAPNGRVVKVVTLIDDHPVIYTEHTLEGFSARTPLGHHAILAADPDAPLSISTSPIRFGTIADAPKEAYANGAYSALQPATDFHTLSKVPTRWKDPPTTDCTTFPSRCGFTDLLAVFQEPRLDRSPAWVAAVNTKQRYVWFSLKDPEILPSTLFWMDYHGRHTPPWRGRNCCIGLEDVCGYLANGLAASVAPNKVNERGVPTSMELRPEAATPVRYIQGAVGTPEGFTRVESVRFEEGAAKFQSEEDTTIRVPVQWEYLYGADL